MEKIFLRRIVPLFVAFCIGCGYFGKSEVVKDNGTIQMGDVVLAPNIFISGEPGFNPMDEAVVGRIDGDKATVFYLKEITINGSYVFNDLRDQSKSEFEIKDLIKVPLTAEPTAAFKPGDKVYVLDTTRGSIRWNAAEIARVDKDLMEAVYISGEKKSVSLGNAPAAYNASSMIRITGEFLVKVGKQAAGTDFQADAKSHRLAIVENYQPKVGDEVLGQDTTISVIQGKILTVEEIRNGETLAGKKVTATPKIGMSFDNNGSPRRAPDVYAYVPLAALQNPPPVVVGQFVVVRPQTSGHWEYAKITAVNGEALDVSVGGATPRTVNKGDYFPLQ